MNIPIYRAKKIDSDEYKIGQLTNLIIPDIEIINENEQKDIEREAYFITKGSLCRYVGNSYEYCGENRFNYMISELNEIDPTTLSIHFKDMKDSQGNKIFASLNKGSKGGDILEFDEMKETVSYDNMSFFLENGVELFEVLETSLYTKVVGIKE